MGVRNSPASGAASYDSNYGVYITKGKSFIFFADENNDQKCNEVNGMCTACSSGGECKNVISILRGISVSEICGTNDPAGIFNNTGACSGTKLDSATITFKRPDPDAKINAIATSGNLTEYNNIGITISAPNGKKKAVIIRSTGQISVENIK